VFFEVNHVSKNFGALTAVHDVSFTLDEGEVLGIMGPNGAGKSTLLNLIMGVYPLTQGEIYFAGQQISGLRTSEISGLGIGRTYQIPQPFKRMTVLENLLVGELYGTSTQSMPAARDNAMALLEKVGLTSKAETLSGSLGLLDLKRLELARALSLRPRLLLLDEIAAGLVESEIRLIQQLINSLKQSGLSMIVIEHILNVIVDHSDRIMVLNFGESIAMGLPQEIVKDPQVIEVYLGEEDDGNGRQKPTPITVARPGEPDRLLSASHINAGYGDFQALFDVSIDINEGEIVTLIGLNGAGKTSLIRALTRQIPLISGDISFRGQSIVDLRPHDIVALGIAQCLEGRKIFPLMTVRENLDLGAYPDRARAKRYEMIEYIYSLFPILAERADQLGGTLSGGEQQMLAIGRALMALPDLIIFDEISLGLAPLIIDHLYESVVKINQKGTTILLVEQNVHRSLHIADRAYIIERGRITLSGIAEELRQNPDVQSAYFGLEIAPNATQTS
jgi:branched-chain amino acid transport system ATP-binding protein